MNLTKFKIMKQIITLLLLVFGFATQSFAIKAPVVPTSANSSEINLDYQKKTGIVNNVKTFVKQKTAKIKSFVKAKTQMERGLLILLAILCSPVAMYFYEGEKWTKRVTINTILYCLCGIPGMIHALIVITGDK